MNVSKPLIVVLILIVVLYVVGVGCGLAPKNNQFKPDDSTLSSLQNLLANPQPLTSDDLSAQNGCNNLLTNPLTMTQGQMCTYDVRASGLPVRRVTLKLESSSYVTATLQQRNVLTGTQTVTATTKMDIYKDGGTLTLKCVYSFWPQYNCVLSHQ